MPTLLFLLWTALPIVCLAPEQDPHQLYVHARTGLSLRAAPAPDAKLLAILSYGTALEQLSGDPQGKPYTAETYGPVALTGRWLKVREPGGNTGFVFEGYAFPFPTQDPARLHDISYLEWFHRQLAPMAEVKTVATDKSVWRQGAMDGRQVTYSNGTQYEYAMYEGGLSEYLTLPDGIIGIARAMVILRAGLFPPDWVETKYDADEQTLYIADPTATLAIRQEGEQLQIALHGG